LNARNKNSEKPYKIKQSRQQKNLKNEG